MKIIYNNIIPFEGYKCINLFGVLFARKDAKIDDVTINHESIHTKQMQEMLFIFFYLWYFVEWFIKLFIYINPHKTYKNVSFEREAFWMEKDKSYLKVRKHYAWLNVLFHS